MTTAMPRTGPLAIEMLGVHKRFGPVLANDDVHLRVEQATLHAIVGENGAGKSTLMSVLYGFYACDAGTIRVMGRPANMSNSQQAIALGIGMVHQHFMLVETLSGLDNVMLGAEPHPLLHRAEALARGKLDALMAATGLRVHLGAMVADMPVGERQRLEILKALYRGARILILDEPTAVLTPQEVGQLFGVLEQLRAQGTTILLITHKLKEVMRWCSRVTVMRAGRVVHDCAVADTSIALLAEAMVGRKLQLERSDATVPPARAPTAAPLLRARALEWRDAQGGARLRGVDLALRAGEIVGVAGVSGNGQSELLELLAGLLAPHRGTLELGEKHFDAGAWIDPRTARLLGVAHVPEDRHGRALVLGFEAWESAVLGYEWLADYCRRGWMDHRAMRRATDAMMERFDVRPRNGRLLSARFSGGNQQKLVLARELGQSPRVLLVGQPTRGVDIGAIEFIYAQLRALRDAGCALLVVSGELDEILALSDRVIVMHQGRIAGELDIAACSEARLGLLMAGGAA